MLKTLPRTTLLPLGSVVATPGALQAMEAAGVRPAELLARHQRGDWGNLCDHDWIANRNSLARGGRVLSSYTAGTATIWVITEADRSGTTLLLPQEY